MTTDANWVIYFSDGSGNGFRFAAREAEVRYAYDPVTPEHSSSGTYSGGSPAHGVLDAQAAATLWRLAEAVAAHGKEPGKARRKGTCLLRIERGDHRRRLVARGGDELRALLAFLAPLRG